MNPTAILFLLLAALLTAGGVRLLITWTLRRQMVDVPGARSSHTRPTPRGGGLAIVGVSLLFWMGWRAQAGGWPALASLATLVTGAVAIAWVSWLDDMRGGLHAGLRFGVHALGAGLAMAGLGHWLAVELPGGIVWHWGAVGLVATFLWITGLTNAYNFMDGIDGIAGVQAVTAGLGWALVGWLLGLPEIAFVALLLVACAIGFLRYNWPPARIFMGDVSSAYLGYVFACLPLLAAAGAVLAPIVAARLPVAALLMVGPFAVDSPYTFVRRLLRRENVFAPHRAHAYQRLVISGLPHRPVTLLYGALGLLDAAAGVCFLTSGNRPAAGALAVAALLLTWVAPLLWLRARSRPPLQE